MKVKVNTIFPAIIEESETGGYTVEFPDISSCVTQGETLEEAKEMAKEALSLTLDCMIDENEVIPEPSNISGENIFMIEGELGTSQKV